MKLFQMNTKTHYGTEISVTQDNDLKQVLRYLPDHYLIENETRRPKRFLLVFEVDSLEKIYSVYRINRETNHSDLELQTEDKQLVLTYLSGIKSGTTYAKSFT